MASSEQFAAACLPSPSHWQAEPRTAPTANAAAFTPLVVQHKEAPSSAWRGLPAACDNGAETASTGCEGGELWRGGRLSAFKAAVSRPPTPSTTKERGTADSNVAYSDGVRHEEGQQSVAGRQSRDTRSSGSSSSSTTKQEHEDEHEERTVGGVDKSARLSRPPCSCGVDGASCLYRWNVQPGEVQFQCSLCHRVLGGNSSNSHLHMLKEHGVDDPCVVWLDTWKSTHRKHRSVVEESKEAAVRRANPKSNGKSTCSPACWERLIEAVLGFYSSRSRRPNEAIFDAATPPEHYCDIETHNKSSTAAPTAKTVQAAPLYCWLVDVWAKANPEQMALLRVYAGSVSAKPVRRPSSLSSSAPLRQDEGTVRPFVGVARACHLLLYRLSVACWVANHSEWRQLLSASSSIIDPAALFRLRDCPFLSLVASCQSPLFVPQPVSTHTEPASTPSEVDYSHPALRLVDRCGMMRLAGTSPATVDVLLIHRLVAVSHSWFSVFRRPELEFVSVELSQQPTEQQLQQIEAYVRAMIARLPAHCELEAAITAVATQLGLAGPRSATEPISVSVQSLLMRMEYAMEQMQFTSKGYLRICMWQRCRSELIALCHQAASQLQFIKLSSRVNLPASSALLEAFLQHARSTLQQEPTAVGGDVVVVTRLLHDEPGCLNGLSLLLVELHDCTVNELQMEERPRVRLWHSLLKLASLYLAIVHPTTDISRPSSSEHQHTRAETVDMSKHCLRCMERRLSERLQQLIPPSQHRDESAAWMHDTAQQAGVSVSMLQRFKELNESSAGVATVDAAQTGTSMSPAAQLEMDPKAKAEPNTSSSQPTTIPPSASTAAPHREKKVKPADTVNMEQPSAARATSTPTPLASPSPQAQCTVCAKELCDALLLPCYHVSCCQPCGLKLMESEKPCPRCSTSIQRIIPIRLEQGSEMAPHKPIADKASQRTRKRASSPRESGRSIRRRQRDEQPQQANSILQQLQQIDQDATQHSTSQPQQSASKASTETAAGNKAVAAEVAHQSPLPSHSTDFVKLEPAASTTLVSTPLDPLDTLASISHQLLSAPVEPAPALPIVDASVVPPSSDGSAVPSLVTVSIEQPSLTGSTTSILLTPHLIRCRVKTGVVRFTCSACGRVFEGNSSNAHLHMTTHHDIRNVPVLCEDGQVKFRKQRTQRPPDSSEATNGGDEEGGDPTSSQTAHRPRTARSTPLILPLSTDPDSADDRSTGPQPSGQKTRKVLDDGQAGGLPALPTISRSSDVNGGGRKQHRSTPSPPTVVSPAPVSQSPEDELKRVKGQVNRAMDAAVLAASAAATTADSEQQRKRTRGQSRGAEAHHSPSPERLISVSC